jgi:hypothetical protein
MRSLVLIAMSTPIAFAAFCSISQAQTPPTPSTGVSQPQAGIQPGTASASTPGEAGDRIALPLPKDSLPDAPEVQAEAPCRPLKRANRHRPEQDKGDGNREPCPAVPSALNPYRRFLDSTAPIPLTPMQKAKLAIHNLKDPGNLATIVGTSGLTIATNSHTAYGPGMKAWGELSGYSFVQDATGEFFGTFLIPSIAHQDPHYHRMPHAKFPRRVLHVLARTVVAQSDDGKLMINYANLLTNPICAEITNLYVPGVHTNGPSTVDRILVGYANDPIGNGIAEFLPDIASHIHIRVIFVQKILNQIAGTQYPFSKPPQPPGGP